MERQNFSSGTLWEDRAGYSRVVKVGPFVEVAGTTASDGQTVHAKGDVQGQTRYIFENISKVLQEAGATLNDVVRVRIYLSDARRWQEVAAEHAHFFGEIKPVMTLVEAKFVHPDILVEIEASAIVSSEL